MYQRTVIVGNLGRDPEMRYTASGTPVANFPVATNRKWSDNDGNLQEETTWFRVSVFGRQAEVCNQFLQKGRTVLCDGDIRTSTYTDQNGVERNSWELRASVVKFMGGAGERAGGGGGGSSYQDEGAPTSGGSVAEDDIPF
jgi:single-strand DNA-binding protein